MLRGQGMKPLPIVWQRLVAGGKTCERCGATEQQVLRALAKLKAALRPLGLEPTLETRELDPAAFRAAPSESNRIWIAGRPMEDWLGARVGGSPCCTVCGDAQCRTVEVGGAVYEAIPEDLLVRAALLAAASLLGPDSAAPGGACCP